MLNAEEAIRGAFAMAKEEFWFDACRSRFDGVVTMNNVVEVAVDMLSVQCPDCCDNIRNLADLPCPADDRPF